MWESRYGFPQPLERDGGHRRYVAAEVDRVLEVSRLRENGMRLETAIAQVKAADSDEARSASSVYAELRKRHPHLTPHTLRKTTLRGLSWAIEDQIRASMTSGYLFGAFQEQRFYEPARPRWLELSEFSIHAFVFAEFIGPSAEGRLSSVPITANAPLRKEWAVVCDGPDFTVALSAWELPRQEDVADKARTFESVWTVDPVAVRDASRVCARIAEDAQAPGAPQAVRRLSQIPSHQLVDHGANALYNRVIAYIDRENK
jgi:MerR family transcriptional regulator, light-induced transcriptional regulator